jgi:hypothetical protein
MVERLRTAIRRRDFDVELKVIEAPAEAKAAEASY